MTSGHRTEAAVDSDRPTGQLGPGTNPIPQAGRPAAGDPAAEETAANGSATGATAAGPGADAHSSRWSRAWTWFRHEGWVPTAGFLVVLAVLLSYSLHQYRTGRNYYDGAYFSQAAWLITHGQPPIVTIRGVHMFADHAYYVFYPIAWLTRPFPDPLPVLIVIQAVALAVAVFPLAVFARRVAGLGTRGVAVLLGAYALYPALSNVNAAEYHPESTAVPLIIWGALLYSRQRWVALFVVTVVVLTCREDLAIPVATAGVLMVLARRWRQGLVVVALAGVSLVVSLGFVIPGHAEGRDLVGDLYAQYGGSTTALLSYAVRHPVGVFADLFSVTNLLVFIALLAPVAFLSLAGWRWALPALPLQVLYLLSSRESAHTILVQYVTQAIPFVFLGAAIGLGRVHGRRALALPLIGASVMTWFSYTVVSPASDLHPWRPSGGFAESKQAAAAVVPDDAAVTATQGAWSVLAERQQLYPYPIADPNWYMPQPDLPVVPVCWAVVEKESPILAQRPLDPAEWQLVREDDLIAVYRSC